MNETIDELQTLLDCSGPTQLGRVLGETRQTVWLAKKRPKSAPTSRKYLLLTRALRELSETKRKKIIADMLAEIEQNKIKEKK